MARLLVRQLDDDVTAAVKDEGVAQQRLGTRLAALFAGIGPSEDISELRAYPLDPVDFEK